MIVETILIALTEVLVERALYLEFYYLLSKDLSQEIPSIHIPLLTIIENDSMIFSLKMQEVFNNGIYYCKIYFHNFT